MPFEFTLKHRVEFSETDLAGIVHFANYYRMMENTEHAFFRSLGFSIQQEVDGVPLGWPRVSASCEFFKPLRFEELVDIELLIAEVRSRSMRYAFRFWRVEPGPRTEVARGEMVTVCARVDRVNGGIAAMPIPEVIRSVLEAAPAERLPVPVVRAGNQGKE